MRYFVGLYITYWQLYLKGLSQYRADFLIGTISGLILAASRLAFIAIIFATIPQVDGWTFGEMALIYGLTVTTLDVWNVVADVPHRIHWYIQGGGLDTLLARPIHPLIQIAGEAGISLNSLGGIAVGVAAIAIALRDATLTASWWWALYLPLVIATGVMLVFGLYLTLACLSFWFTNVYSVLATVAWSAIFGQFPVTIYTWPLRFLFTWIVPFAMIGFYPAAFLLRGEDYRIYGLIAPLMGVGFLSLALWVWGRAIRRYQSTGS